MTNVEAAASLFGSDDSTSDPFASLGLGEDNAQAPANSSAPSAPGPAAWDQTFGQQHSDAHAIPTNHHEDASRYSAFPEDSLNAPVGSAMGGTAGYDQAYDQSWPNTYEVASNEQTSSYHTNVHANGNTYEAPHAYDPYAPYSNAPAEPSASYDPYAPSATTSVNQPTHSHMTSIPVAPVQNIQHSDPSTHYASAYSTHPTHTYGLPEQPSIPPPPAPKVPLSRPKVSNAYDPPFPTTSRRTNSRPPTSQASLYNGNYGGGVSSPFTTTPHHAGHPTYATPAPVALPPTGAGDSPYGRYAEPPTRLQQKSPPVDGLPGTRDALASLYGPQTSSTTSNQRLEYDPYTPAPQDSATSTMDYSPPLVNGGPYSRSPPTAQTTLARPSHGVYGADVHMNGDVVSPVQPYSPSLGVSALPRPGSRGPLQAQSHLRKSSVDIPKGMSTSEPNGQNILQRTSSPISQRAYSPLVNHRTASPASMSYAPPAPRSPALDSFPPSGAHVNGTLIPPYPNYTPSQVLSNDASEARHRSMSNGSAHSPEDAYAPPKATARSTYSAQEPVYGSPHFGLYSANDTPLHSTATSTYTPPSFGEQDLTVKSSQALYAPSPSLLGSNDPLGRTSAKAPIFSFGFGGKFVTCFHGADTLHTGFDVALSARNSTGVHIRVLHKLIPTSALASSSASFPGPLFSDPGTPTTSLVRTGTTTQTKNKKAGIKKYLEDRAEEISRGLGYLPAGSNEKPKEEGKLVLTKLLKILVDNDGKLTGSSQIDSAVRAALVPHTEDAAPSDAAHIVGLGLSSVPDPREMPIATTHLRASALDKIQEFLIRGERKQAYHYALDEKLWGHALVIASGIDKESWKEAVNEFLKVELGFNSVNPTTQSSTGSGRDSLRLAYSLFSGQGAAAVQELSPVTRLGNMKPSLSIPHLNPNTPTPLTPNFNAPVSTYPLSAETLSAWPEMVAMMLVNPMTPEVSSALTALGDQLASNHWIEAAHVCYLLSPQTSPVGGIGNPSARIILLGGRSPSSWPNFTKDLDPIIFTEIFEFALALSTPTKGQEPFPGFPHLQAYRLVHALSLLELGHVQMANRYCEAITAALGGRGSPYFTAPFMEQLRSLTDRITGSPNVDKSGSWIGSKLSKPSLDSIGGWLEGRFTKLVTGDAESTSPSADSKMDSQVYGGPFSHYSSISSATPSARSSPQPLPSYPHNATNGHAPIDRASSAMDYIRRKPSPVPRIASASAAGTSSFQTSPFISTYQNGYTAGPNSADSDLVTPRPSEDGDDAQEAGWWGASSHGRSTANQTPTAMTFMKVDAPFTGATDGFISPMNPPSFDAPPPSHSSYQPQANDEEDDDLGLGNSRAKKEVKAEETRPAAEVSSKPAEPQKSSAEPPAATGSWLSRWWNKSDKPGPIKANLGEENSFYYDPEQKRWVNKKAGAAAEVKPAAPPPPPSRARTASPAMTASNGPPPPRAASAIDLSTSPPSKTIMRVRSNLAPPPAESAPSTPTGLRSSVNGGPPPPARPKSQATKRNIRSRYVDVFQTEGA